MTFSSKVLRAARRYIKVQLNFYIYYCHNNKKMCWCGIIIDKINQTTNTPGSIAEPTRTPQSNTQTIMGSCHLPNPIIEGKNLWLELQEQTVFLVISSLHSCSILTGPVSTNATFQCSKTLEYSFLGEFLVPCFSPQHQT